MYFIPFQFFNLMNIIFVCCSPFLEKVEMWDLAVLIPQLLSWLKHFLSLSLSLSHYHLCADPGLLFMVVAAIFIILDYVELSV